MKLVFAMVPLFLICLLGAFGLYGVSAYEGQVTAVVVETPTAIYQRITAEQAKAKMDTGEQYVLLDVRTEEEFNESRIDGAILIPFDEIMDRAESELPDKNVLILVYCRSGRRSANAANELVAMGYTNVYDFGGIIDWPYDTAGR